MKKWIPIVLFLILIGAVLAIVVSGATIWGGGFRVDMKGRVVYHPLEEDDWEINYYGAEISIDQSIFTTKPMEWFWETPNCYVEIELYGNKDYTAGMNIGSFDQWGENTPFTVAFRHVEEGYYTATINVYYLKGGFFGWGATKELKESKIVDVSVFLGGE